MRETKPSRRFLTVLVLIILANLWLSLTPSPAKAKHRDCADPNVTTYCNLTIRFLTGFDIESRRNHGRVAKK